MNTYRIRIVMLLVVMTSGASLEAQNFWIPVTAPTSSSIDFLFAHPSHRLFAASEQGGAWMSDDRGDSWSQSGLGSAAISEVDANPYSGVLHATTSTGYYQSTNNGNSWQQRANEPLNYHPALCFAFRNAQVNYAGSKWVNQTLPAQLYQTTAGGTNWDNIRSSAGDIVAMAISPTNGHLFYAVHLTGMVRTPDDITYTNVNAGLTSYAFSCMTINTRGQLFLGTSDSGIFRSTNNGATWTQINAGLGSVKVRAIVVNELFVLFAATDAGVFRSVNNGGSWTPLNAGLTTQDIRTLALDDEGLLYAGAHDGSVFRSNGSTLVSFSAQRSMSFGDVPVAQTSMLPLTVRNTGTKPLDISSAQSANPAFIVTPGSAVIPPAGSYEFTVEFKPQQAGPDYSNLVFSHNGQSSPDIVAVSGNGVAPVFTAQPPFLLFGDVPLGNKQYKDIRVQNSGNAPLSISSALSDNTAFDVSPFSAYIAPGDFQDFTIGFDAREAKQYVGTIIFSDNTAAGVNSVQVSGTGSTAEIRLSGTQLSFGDVPVGTRRTDSILVTSSGRLPLQILSVDSDNSVFSASTAVSTLLPGEKTAIRITFIPTRRGQEQGILTVRHNGPLGETQIRVDGIGAEPVFSLNRNAVDFGQVTMGMLRRDSVIVRNDGNADLVVQSALTSPPFDVQPSGAVLKQQESAVFIVSYFPPALGPSKGILLFTHGAATSPDTVVLEGNGIAQPMAIFAVEPRSLAFGDVPLGSSLPRSVIVKNPGTDTLRISSVNSAPALFTVTPKDTVLEPGGSMSYTISFTPTAIGSRQGTVVFTHNGQPGRDTVRVQGSGAAASRPIFSLTPDQLVLANTAIGDTTDDSAMVTNLGNALLRVTQIRSSNSVFAVTPTNANVDSGLAQSIRVRFIPKATGLQSSNIIITHNGTTSPDTLLVSARGVDPVLPIFATSTAAVQFDTVDVGRSDTASVMVRNPGNAPLVITSVSSDTAAFRVTPLAGTIPAGDSALFTIEFAPLAAGTQAGLLTFVHNGSPSSDKILVSGTGRNQGGSKAQFSILPTALNFGFVEIGGDATESLVVHNSGTEVLRIDAITVSNDVFVILPNAAVSVPPGDSVLFSVRFAPRTTEDESGVLEFRHNAGSGSDRVWLAGAGFAMGLTLSKSHVDFGTLEIGASQGDTIIVQNRDEFPATITSVSSDNPQFSISPASATISIFESRAFVVRFTPTAEGQQQGSLQLLGPHSAPLATITASGTGIAGAVMASAGEARAGDDVPVTVTVQSGFPTNTSRLYYREAGAADYGSLPLAPSGSTFTASIPGARVGLRGIEYYVEIASSSGDSLFFPSAEPRERPALLRVSIAGADYPHAMSGDTYRMISVPVDLAVSTPAEVLEDDLGPYNTRHWRLFHWEGGEYREYRDALGRLTPGTAMWLVTYNGMPFDVGSALSVDTRAAQQIRLEPGWNQLAGPFAFPVAWSDVLAASGTDSSIVSQPYFFNGSEYLPGRRALLSWDGYFVYNDSFDPVILTVPPVEANAGLTKSMDAAPITSDFSTAVQIVAAFPEAGREERHNFVGFREGKGTLPRIDVLEPPAPDRFGGISIMDGDARVMESFVPENGRGAAWDLKLEAPAASTRADIRFLLNGALPRGYSLYLFDLDAGRAVPIESGAARIENLAGTRELRIVIGSDEDARMHGEGISPVPLPFAVLDASPNPSAGETAVRYSVDQRSPVHASIHDGLGRLVRTLVRSEAVAGIYTLVWDGHDEAGQRCRTGSYFVRITAGDRVLTQKILRISK